ncbi:2TM domain-containing protein [Patescibacteria group bacterium]|nr:2TM domain-containing protein [Patescibacteria group bacterium]MBU1673553.1 2TM domain-containing protein [Patescibacteria group bacterium]MBU1963631.1 2TM domain-containing protein [Patescibacteria group bacterium]
MADEARKRAEKRVGELKGFYTNLITYVVMNVVLFVINLVTSPGHWWFYWVTIFWGIAVLIHGVTVFTGGTLSKGWEEKKTQELMDKEKEEK